MNQQRVINDIVVLGQACPDIDKDGKVVICLAGYSLSEKGFIRLYPTRHDLPIRRWDIIQADVEYNTRDRRFESWKLRGDYADMEKRIRKTGELKGKQRVSTIASIADPCVEVINDGKRSLGVVKAETLRASYQQNRKNGGLFQKALYGESDLRTRRDYPHLPYYQYTCAGGVCSTDHNQQLLEWGAFEFLRKNPLDGDALWGALRVYDGAYDHYLFVGNQWAHRSAFMVISDLRMKRPESVQMVLV